MELQRTSLAPFFAISALVLTASWFLSGCRFGNRVEETPLPKLDGYYLMEPEKLTLCANSNSTQCAEVSLNSLPALLRDFYPNPVQFSFVDTFEQLGSLHNPTNPDFGFPLYYSSTGQLGFSGGTESEPFWDESGCTTSFTIIQAGVMSFTPGAIAFGYPINGRIDFSIQIRQDFRGPCAQAFNEIHACFQNPTQCANPEDYNAVHSFLDPYVQGGVLPENSIPQITQLVYQADYL